MAASSAGVSEEAGTRPDYATAEAGTPAGQFCYVQNHRTGLTYQFANGAKLKPFDAEQLGANRLLQLRTCTSG